MDSLNILLVCDQFSPDRSNHCYGLANSFVKLGNRVVILSSKHMGKTEVGSENDRIGEIEIIRIPSIFIDKISWVYTPSAPARIAKAVKDYDIEIINAMHLVHHSTFTSINAKIPKNVPIVLSVLGTRENMGNAFLNLATRVFEHTFAKKALTRSQGIIADCLETKMSVTKFGHFDEKIKVIYEGVDTSKFFPIDRLPNKTYNITFLGGLRMQKGVYDLMRAAPDIINNIPNSVIRFVGDGPERQGLEKMRSHLGLEKGVIFTGAQPRDKVSEILRETDCFVLPSWSEGISMAVLEAAASSLPIVTTNVGGSKELIEHKNNGLLVTPRCPQDIAESIIWLSQNPGKAKEIGMAARKMAKSLDWMNIAEQTLEYYNAVLSGNT